jgi:fumarate reductase (CoM/CoB) subunit A
MQMRQNIIYPEGLRGMLPPYDGFITEGGRFYNGLHERYMRRYHPEKLEKLSRAEITKCAQLEINAKRQSAHGGIYGDLSDVPKERIYSVESFIKACKDEGFDPTYQCYEWAPASHHFMGGVVINANCETGIGGLYAAGEVVAGVHGANRMAGNALTETQVFGAIAGKNAASQAKTRALICPSSSLARLEKERLIMLFNRNEGVDYKQIRAEITEILSHHVGVIRDEDGLKSAIDSLEEIKRNKLGHLYLSGERSFKALSELLEVENLLTLGQLVAQAAMLRTESRGAHYRKDYSATSHEWEKNIFFQMVGINQTTRIVPIN